MSEESEREEYERQRWEEDCYEQQQAEESAREDCAEDRHSDNGSGRCGWCGLLLREAETKETP